MTSQRTIVTACVAATAAAVAAANLADRGMIFAIIAGLGIGIVSATVAYLVMGLSRER